MIAYDVEQSIKDLTTGAYVIEFLVGAIGGAATAFALASITSLWLAVLVSILLAVLSYVLITVVPFMAMVRFPQQTEAIGRTANGFVRGITGMFKKTSSTLSA